MSKKNLVIVESPAKAKTIGKYLGKEFLVTSSYGHIRDLSKGDDAIDKENNFRPNYVVSPDKKKLVKELKELTKSAETVWLASDDDREGEAISWHLSEVLNLKEKDTKRIVFNEITKQAIENAIKNPRNIDINLVNAQQARRVLDRLVGFELSPLLWKKVKPSLSAGRVQSVAVKLVVEREREIRNFEVKSDFRIVAEFSIDDRTFKATLDKRFTKEEDAVAFLEKSKDSKFTVKNIEKKPSQRNPAPPFTTSTLQQEASRKLGAPVGVTMMLAQKLYEEGHITYMRTDSVNLSGLAINNAKNTIIEEYGENYSKVRNFKTKSTSAQEAHEAIRPTNFNVQFAGTTEQEKRLYNLIWKRAIASQMASAELEKTIVEIESNNHSHLFIAEGEIIKFDGFLKVYMASTDDEESEDTKGILPPLAKGNKPNANEIKAEERFTNPPARYTEASLVKKLEELGIGRPSTYAPTISTIQKRGYVEVGKSLGTNRKFKVHTLKNGKIDSKSQTEKTGSDKGKLLPTDIGSIVTDFLSEHFQKIMDYGFTASVEKKFDNIAEGEQEWTEMLDEFYAPFHKLVSVTDKNSGKATGEREVGVDPKSGKTVVVKMGRFGPYAQIVEEDEDKKPKSASLRPEQSMETITIEEVMDLFKLPRTLGEFEGEEMVVNVGRFGPYILHKKKFYTLPKTFEPLDVTTEEAIKVIKDKMEEDSKFPFTIGKYEDIVVEVNKGRYGPYIIYNSKNYAIPKSTNFQELTIEDAISIIDKKDNKTQKAVIKTIGENEEEIQVLTGMYGPYFKYKGSNYKITDIDPNELTLEQAQEIIKKTPAKKSRKGKSKK